MEQNVETLPSHSHVSGDLLVCQVTPTLAPMLLQQFAVIDGHAAVDGFAHVVDGEQGDLHGGQGFIQINNLSTWHSIDWPDPVWLVGQNLDKISRPLSVYRRNM